ncbi:MAG: hypothetical protein NTZ35_00325 [Ignavibacteriales bacterium]|nr:hypothetical protein [Ignavibacteriales bacterium]
MNIDGTSAANFEHITHEQDIVPFGLKREFLKGAALDIEPKLGLACLHAEFGIFDAADSVTILFRELQKIPHPATNLKELPGWFVPLDPSQNLREFH